MGSVLCPFNLVVTCELKAQPVEVRLVRRMTGQECTDLGNLRLGGGGGQQTRRAVPESSLQQLRTRPALRCSSAATVASHPGDQRSPPRSHGKTPAVPALRQSVWPCPALHNVDALMVVSRKLHMSTISARGNAPLVTALVHRPETKGQRPKAATSPFLVKTLLLSNVRNSAALRRVSVRNRNPALIWVAVEGPRSQFSSPMEERRSSRTTKEHRACVGAFLEGRDGH
jgi:hypothetical protein